MSISVGNMYGGVAGGSYTFSGVVNAGASIGAMPAPVNNSSNNSSNNSVWRYTDINDLAHALSAALSQITNTLGRPPAVAAPLNLLNGVALRVLFA